MYQVITNQEYKERINEILKEKGKIKADVIREMAERHRTDNKTAENHIYRMPASFIKLTDVAYAIDPNTLKENFLYITGLSDIEEPTTLEAHAEISGDTLNVTVGKNVTINNIKISFRDDIEQASDKMVKLLTSNYTANISSKFVMRFTCTKELHVTSAYPIPSENYRYRSYENVTMKDNYIVVDGNIYHEEEGHIFGYKHSQHDKPISLYGLIESVSEKNMSYEQARECIKQFQRTYQRQGAYYGTIGRSNVSINAFCWLNFTAGYLATLGKNL